MITVLILFVFVYTAVSAAKDAAGHIDINKAMEVKARLDEFTAEAEESSKKDD